MRCKSLFKVSEENSAAAPWRRRRILATQRQKTCRMRDFSCGRTILGSAADRPINGRDLLAMLCHMALSHTVLRGLGQKSG